MSRLLLFTLFILFNLNLFSQTIEKNSEGKFIVIMPDGSYEDFDEKNNSHKSLMKEYVKNEKISTKSTKEDDLAEKKIKKAEKELAEKEKEAEKIHREKEKIFLKAVKAFDTEKIKGALADEAMEKRMKSEYDYKKFIAENPRKKVSKEAEKLKKFLDDNKEKEKQAKKSFIKALADAREARKQIFQNGFDVNIYPEYRLKENKPIIVIAENNPNIQENGDTSKEDIPSTSKKKNNTKNEDITKTSSSDVREPKKEKKEKKKREENTETVSEESITKVEVEKTEPKTKEKKKEKKKVEENTEVVSEESIAKVEVEKNEPKTKDKKKDKKKVEEDTEVVSEESIAKVEVEKNEPKTKDKKKDKKKVEEDTEVVSEETTISENVKSEKKKGSTDSKKEERPILTLKSSQNVMYNPPYPPCYIDFDGIDDFTKIKRKETRKEVLFQFTDDVMLKFYEKNDFLTCSVSASRTDKGYKYLTFYFVFNSDNVQNTYGVLEKDYVITIRFMDGEQMPVYNSKTDRGLVDYQKKTTTYKAVVQLTSVQEKKLFNGEVDQMRILWGTGTDDYPIYNLDFFSNLLNCIK